MISKRLLTVSVAVAVLTAGSGAGAGPAATGAADCGGGMRLADGSCPPPPAAAESSAAVDSEAGAAEAAPESPSASAQPAADGRGGRAEYLHRVAWVGFGVGAVGFATWAITGGIALAKTQSLEDDCPDDACPAESEEDLDTARSLAHVATAGLVLGVLGGMTGAIALLVAGGEGGEAEPAGGASAVSVQAAIGPGFVGLQGSF